MPRAISIARVGSPLRLTVRFPKLFHVFNLAVARRCRNASCWLVYIAHFYLKKRAFRSIAYPAAESAFFHTKKKQTVNCFFFPVSQECSALVLFIIITVPSSRRACRAALPRRRRKAQRSPYIEMAEFYARSAFWETSGNGD